MDNKNNQDFFVMHENGVRRNSKELKELNEKLNLSRRDTYEEQDYRTDQHRSASLYLNIRPKMAINNDTDSSDSDDDEAVKVAKKALYSKEYIRSQ